jgi:hypothetical protein
MQPSVEGFVHSFQTLQPLADPIAMILPRVDYDAYLAKVGEIANRLSLARIDRSLKTGDMAATGKRSAAHSDIQGRVSMRKPRKARRLVQQTRVLSTAGKAHIDLQIKMLHAIPPQARAEFLNELAEHGRKFPSSGRYLRNLADKGNDLAQEVLARMGAE